MSSINRQIENMVTDMNKQTLQKGTTKMTTKKADYGLKLTGVVRVFRKDKDIEDKQKKVKFTVSDVWFNTSEKDEEDNWFNISTNLIFKRGIEPPLNNSVIEIVEAFPMINGSGKYRRMVYYVGGWHYAEGYDNPTN